MLTNAQKTKNTKTRRSARTSSNSKYVSLPKVKSKAVYRDSSQIAKKIILGIIALTMLTTVIFVFFNLVATPEFLLKRQVESMTRDYYENFFYPQILANNQISESELSDSATSEAKLLPIFDKYQAPGFPRLTLRHLTLYDDAKYRNFTGTLAKYCDLDKTQIKIFPESPFKKSNYRVEYDYTCNYK